MKRIHIHWTGGAYTPTALDLEHYHWLIDGDGKVHQGKFPESANDRANLADGKYAAHTLHANSHAIGVSMCAMGGATESPFNAGKWPLKIEQWNAMVKLVADRAKTHGIHVTPETILTHAEVQANLGIKQRGKWDITRLPWDTSARTAREVGNRLRQAVSQELAKTAAKPAVSPPVPVLPPKAPEPPKPIPAPVAPIPAPIVTEKPVVHRSVLVAAGLMLAIAVAVVLLESAL